jgi:1-acyl-sn-glycerol-3-phosphate acyltransferase
MIYVRSILFHAAFYLVTAVMLIGTLPFFFFLSEKNAMVIVHAWSRACIYLHEVIAGVRLEVRGRENLPKGGAIVASKHQSAFETFALLPQLRNPTIVMKKAIRWFPIFGAYTITTGMIHIDRSGKTGALRGLTDRAKEEIAKDREILMFPEGTRRPVGAPPKYHSGVALLYRSLGVPVVPVAVNTGVFWPRKSFLHYPGTAVIEFLSPIPPGLDAKVFFARLQEAIETATDRLVAEARKSG